MSKGIRRVVLSLTAALAIVSLGYFFFWIPLMRKARYFDVVTVCSSNLRRIGQAIQQYEAAYHDWPLRHDDWEHRLIAAGLVKERDLRCPVRKDKTFHYFVGSQPTTQPKLTGNEILLFEDPDAHWSYSGCILYVDGHVQSIKLDKYPPELLSRITGKDSSQ